MKGARIAWNLSNVESGCNGQSAKQFERLKIGLEYRYENREKELQMEYSLLLMSLQFCESLRQEEFKEITY